MENDVKKGLNNPFLALRHKNFLIYMIGMCVSLIGTWMQNIAQPWLAYTLTDSPLLLSLVGILQFLPIMLFSLFAGIIIDRFPKKKILFFTQSASLVITLILAILVYSGHVQYWHILVTTTALGFVNTLDMPTRQAFVIEMVGKEDMPNAIALNSSVFNVARVFGPALAGVVIAVWGIATCFYINSISFAAVIISLIFIKPITIQSIKKIDKKVIQSIKDGLRYVIKNKTLLNTSIVVLIVGTFAFNHSVLVPVFTKMVLNRQEDGFGFLMSFMGIGAFFGAIYVAAKSKHGPIRFVLRLFPLLAAFVLMFIGFTNSYYITALCIAVAGFFNVAYISSANCLLQLNTDDEYRGRVMSVYTWVLNGSTPIGSLYAGAVTQYFGAPAGFIACGAIIVILLIASYLWNSRAVEEKV